MDSTVDSIKVSAEEQEFDPNSNITISKPKLGYNSKEPLDQIKFDRLKTNNDNVTLLNVIQENSAKKFFVKLIGYNPRFFDIKNIKKKINDVIEDYLKGINVNICDKIKRSFAYRGKNINLDETIENIEHLSWIISDYTN